MWNQVYDPFNNWILSTLAAALPVVTLLVLIASNKVKAHIAAIVALIVANLVAISIFTMPSGLALRATVLGAVTGFFPIGWIVLNVIFLYRLTVEKGTFETLQTTIGGVTTDRRLQLLLIAFSFGAFFEGASSTGKRKQSEPLPCRIKSGKANRSGNPPGGGPYWPTLAARGANLAIVGRSKTRTRIALARIRTAAGRGATVATFIADLADDLFDGQGPSNKPTKR